MESVPALLSSETQVVMEDPLRIRLELSRRREGPFNEEQIFKPSCQTGLDRY
jgi:hypothetical protein